MIEKERQARENEREKQEQEAMMNDGRGRPAVQAHDEREAEKQQEKNMKEMKIRFGRLSWQKLRDSLSRRSQLLSMGTGS